MPSRLDGDDLDIEEAPTAINPYTVLSLDKDATPDQIKSAYKKAALRWHPDKVPADQKDDAHTKFQGLAFAYAILSDARRKSRYDTTGRTEDSLDLDDDNFDWVAFYKEQFADVITGASITRFALEYKGSEEERRAVLNAFERHKGSMTKVYQDVMLSDAAEDEERFRGIVDDAIGRGDAEPYTKYTGESAKARLRRVQDARKRKERETGEAEQYARKIGVHDKLFGGREEGEANGGSGKTKSREADQNADLASMIQNRQASRGQDFLANLEAKYAPKGNKGKRKVDDEPPEEAFAAARAKKGGKKGKATAAVEEDTTEGARRSKRTHI